jgi:diguanylate cyclase (GGDEF)-like protein
MVIDVPTLLVLVAMLSIVVGGVFLSAWLRDRDDGAALRAAAGVFSVAVGVALALTRVVAAEWLSVVAANTFLTLGFGLIWSAVRTFEHRTAPLSAVLAGVIVWLVACSIPAFYAVMSWRLVLSSLTAAAYSIAVGFEFWRGRDEYLWTRDLLIAICFGHAAITVVRAALIIFDPPTGALLQGNWLLGLLLVEPPLVLIAGAFLAVHMARERSEHVLRQQAETDELTGLLNRRAFFARSKAVIGSERQADRPVVLLLFDLDHFKAVNDRFGHAAGDRTLRLFAEIGAQAVRSTDLFGRIGGEEFAALLPGCDAATAESIAERIRLDLSAKAILHEGSRVITTVSVGVASMSGKTADLDTLMAHADAALYESKRAGRDRVSGSLAAAS